MITTFPCQANMVMINSSQDFRKAPRHDAWQCKEAATELGDQIAIAVWCGVGPGLGPSTPAPPPVLRRGLWQLTAAAVAAASEEMTTNGKTMWQRRAEDTLVVMRQGHLDYFINITIIANVNLMNMMMVLRTVRITWMPRRRAAPA